MNPSPDNPAPDAQGGKPQAREEKIDHPPYQSEAHGTGLRAKHAKDANEEKTKKPQKGTVQRPPTKL